MGDFVADVLIAVLRQQEARCRGKGIRQFRDDGWPYVRRAVLYPIEQRATYAHHEREARFRDVAVRAHASDVLAKHGREPALIRLVIIQRTMFVLGLHVH